MNEPCEGYACSPTNTVPVSEVVVHRPPVDQHPATGIQADPTLGLLGVAAIIIGAYLVIVRRKPTRRNRD